MTYPVLNNARHVAIVTTGGSKAEALKRCLKPDKPDDVLPAGLVKAKQVTWLVDEAAYGACKWLLFISVVVFVVERFWNLIEFVQYITLDVIFYSLHIQ